MINVIKFVFFVSNVLSLTTCRTWSSWSTCESIPNCFRRRVLTCDDGEGIQCARDELYEQRAVSLSMNECDERCMENNSSRSNVRVSHKRTLFLANYRLCIFSCILPFNSTVLSNTLGTLTLRKGKTRQTPRGSSRGWVTSSLQDVLNDFF